MNRKSETQHSSNLGNKIQTKIIQPDDTNTDAMAETYSMLERAQWFKISA